MAEPEKQVSQTKTQEMLYCETTKEHTKDGMKLVEFQLKIRQL